MDVQEQFKSIAALIGEPARAVMLWNLLDGRALTATELAMGADVSPQSASMHLSKLVQAGILAVERQGRHRYYRFSKAETAYVIEAMANLVPAQKVKDAEKKNTEPPTGIRYCRTCYDHLAGRAGVAVTEQLLKLKIIVADGAQYDVTAKGMQWFEGLGIAVTELKDKRRVFARQCLDWSERRHHLAGALGAAMLDRMLHTGWIRRVKSSRAAIITAKGQGKFYEVLRLSL